MKKKVLAMVMAVAMTVGMLAGCGSKAEDTATDAPAAETTTTEAEASTSVSGDVKVAYMAKNVVDAFAVNMNNYVGEQLD